LTLSNLGISSNQVVSVNGSAVIVEGVRFQDRAVSDIDALSSTRVQTDVLEVNQSLKLPTYPSSVSDEGSEQDVPNGGIYFNGSHFYGQTEDGPAQLDVAFNSGGGWTLKDQSITPSDLTYRVAIGAVSGNTQLYVNGDALIEDKLQLNDVLSFGTTEISDGGSWRSCFQ
jgi:hypothetical protein